MMQYFTTDIPSKTKTISTLMKYNIKILLHVFVSDKKQNNITFSVEGATLYTEYFGIKGFTCKILVVQYFYTMVIVLSLM